MSKPATLHGPRFGPALLRLTTAGVLSALLLVGCGGESGTQPIDGDDGPVPGTVEVTVVGEREDGRATLLRLSGSGLSNLRTVEAHDLYVPPDGAGAGVVVVGPLEAGPVLRFDVPDIGTIDSYEIEVVELAAPDYALLDPEALELELRAVE